MDHQQLSQIQQTTFGSLDGDKRTAAVARVGPILQLVGRDLHVIMMQSTKMFTSGGAPDTSRVDAPSPWHVGKNDL